MIGYDSKPIRDYCWDGLLGRVGSEREVKGEGVILPGIQGPMEGSPSIQNEVSETLVRMWQLFATLLHTPK